MKFVGLTPHNKERVRKILKASKSSNRNNTIEFGCSLLQMDYLVSEQGMVVGIKPMTIGRFNINKIVVDENDFGCYEVHWRKRM